MLTAVPERQPTSTCRWVAMVLQSRFLLPALFLFLVGPVVLMQVFLTPPIQVPDEENHMLRASQLMDGRLFGQVLPNGTAGGPVDPLLPIFGTSFNAMKAHPEMKIDSRVHAAAAAMQWRSGPKTPFSFSNTAIYPFFLYLPASAGLAAGRRWHLSIMDSFYLGRLATAVASLALGATALLFCGRGRTMLFLILSFPMTTSLFASVSQDAMSITLGALGAAIWSCYATHGGAMPPAARAATALALGAVVAARLPLAPLYLLALLPTHRPDRVDWPRSSEVMASLAGLAPIMVALYGAHLAKVPLRPEDGVSAAAQIHWIVAHPLAALHVGTATLGHDAERLLGEVVGTLGWLDTPLPAAFHKALWICAALAVMLDGLTPRARLGWWSWLPILAVGVVVTDIAIALYIVWTPVGAQLIQGFQGRYFLVTLIILAVSLPGRRPDAAVRLNPLIEAAKVVLCATAAVLEVWTVPVAIIHRYYS